MKIKQYQTASFNGKIIYKFMICLVTSRIFPTEILQVHHSKELQRALTEAKTELARLKAERWLW